MDLFQFIKDKAVKAAQAASSFIQQNPTPAGFIQNQAQRLIQPLQNNPAPRGFGQAIQSGIPLTQLLSASSPARQVLSRPPGAITPLDPGSLFGGFKQDPQTAMLDTIMGMTTAPVARRPLSAILSGTNAPALPRKPASAITVTPEGTAFRMSSQPRSTSSLDQILEQVRGVNPPTPKPPAPLMLPAPKNTTLAVVPKAPPVETILSSGKKNAGLVRQVGKYKEQMLEPKRFLKEVLPDNLYGKVKTEIFNKLNDFRGQAAGFKNNYIKKAQSLGMGKGSKLSEFTQKLGEGKVTYEQVVGELGEHQAQKVLNANNTFRAMYDEILGVVNTNRIQDGLEPLAKRKDYYRHMQEIGGADDWLSRMVSGGAGPKSASIFKKREGDKTVYDAVGGFVDYLERAGRAGFTDRVAPNIKALSAALREQGAPAQTIQYLDDYADQILGVMKDEGGLVNAANAVGGKLRSAKVLGNPGSILAQPLNTSLGASDAGWGNYMKGFVSEAAETASKASAYLKDRAYRTPVSLEKGLGKVKAGLGAVLQQADVVSTKAIWKGFFEKAKAVGEANPIQFADDATEAVVGSRGVGGFSKFQNSKLGQLLAPFTVEPQAGANRVIELVGEKKAGVLIGLAVSNWLINFGFEKVGPGYRPLPDPIQATMDAYKLATGDEEKEPNKLQAATRIITEFLSGVAPAALSIGASAENLAEKTGLLPEGTSRTLFGQEDPTRMNVADLYNPASNIDRNITGNKIIDYPLNLASKLVPGVNTLARGIQGDRFAKQGFTESKAGNVMFETPQDPVSQVRQRLFGPWSTKEAKDFFSSSTNKTLSPEKSSVYKQLPEDQKSTYLNKTQEQRVNENKLEQILKSGSTGANLGSAVADADYKTARDYVTKALTGGAIPDKADLRNGFFKNRNPKSPLLEERMEVYKDIKSAMNNENYTDEQKEAILEASEASKTDISYHLQASKDKDVKLQELLPKWQKMELKELMVNLSASRKAIGGQQLLTSEMITYLYDNDMIGKEEQKMLNALKFDEVNNKFYFSRSFRESNSGGGKKLSFAQAKRLFNVKIPSFSSMQKAAQAIGRQTSSQGDTLLQGIQQKQAKRLRL